MSVEDRAERLLVPVRGDALWVIKSMVAWTLVGHWKRREGQELCWRWCHRVVGEEDAVGGLHVGGHVTDRAGEPSPTPGPFCRGNVVALVIESA